MGNTWRCCSHRNPNPNPNPNPTLALSLSLTLALTQTLTLALALALPLDQVLLTPEGGIAGARVRTFLLEKRRVT